MKWLKLMTDFDRDEKIEALTGKYGFAGQGKLLKIYRIIAEQMDESNRCSATYRPGFWARSLGFRSEKDCESFLKWLATDQRLIGFRSLIDHRSIGDRLAIDQQSISDRSVNEWTVTCPKLLEIRARKKPIGCKTRTLDIDTDIDTDTDTPIPPKKGAAINGIDQDFEEEFWPIALKKVAKRTASRAYKSARKRADKEIIHSAFINANKVWEERERRYIPHPASWLNGDGWMDEKEKSWQEQFLEETNDKRKLHGTVQ